MQPPLTSNFAPEYRNFGCNLHMQPWSRNNEQNNSRKGWMLRSYFWKSCTNKIFIYRTQFWDYIQGSSCKLWLWAQSCVWHQQKMTMIRTVCWPGTIPLVKQCFRFIKVPKVLLRVEWVAALFPYIYDTHQLWILLWYTVLIWWSYLELTGLSSSF